MGFIGPVSRLDGRLVRPHDVAVSLTPGSDSIEAMVLRVVHLGFEVRIELEMPGGEVARAQLTRAQTEELELGRGDIVYVRPPAEAASPHRVTQASGSSASRSTDLGSLPVAMSATVTCSTTLRRLARTAIQTRSSSSAAPA